MIGRLARKSAIVTGASSGIGRSLAMALAREGASVVLLGRRLDALRSLADECSGLGGRATAYEADFLKITQFGGLRAKIAKDTPIDILVHSAGMYAAAAVPDASLQDFELMFRCNVLAPFALTQAFLPDLRQTRGQVVFINSTAGLSSAAGAQAGACEVGRR